MTSAATPVRRSGGFATRVDADGFPVLSPTLLTIHRTSARDEQSRQIICALDGKRFGQVLFGQRLTIEIAPGAHTLRVHNTLVWKTAPFEAPPGGHVHFTVWNRGWGEAQYLMIVFVGAAPLGLGLAPGTPEDVEHPANPQAADPVSSGSGSRRHLMRISAAAHGLVRTRRTRLDHTADMNATVMGPLKAGTLFGLSLAIAAMGIYVADADDAPGAAVMGMLLMVVGVVLGVRAGRNRLPVWAARTAVAVGVVLAAFAAFLTHGVVVAAPLFPQAREVPSVVGAAPSGQYAAAVERARDAVRAAVVEQNLPGVSVAVGAGGTLVWAEGFGWRDVATRAPVTPATRFNIGTAASAVGPAVVPLRLPNTGADSAAEWSPERIGEPEEDFPLFTILRDVVFRPLGLAPATPLAGERATFYVPRSDDDPGRGRRLMYMRDLACCANGKAFYSTPSDLVRFALATNPNSLDGELAGGTVMSLVTHRDSGLAVAVTSNMAQAKTAALALRVGAAFAEPPR